MRFRMMFMDLNPSWEMSNHGAITLLCFLSLLFMAFEHILILRGL